MVQGKSIAKEGLPQHAPPIMCVTPHGQGKKKKIIEQGLLTYRGPSSSFLPRCSQAEPLRLIAYDQISRSCAN